jgi:SAM-dependent methyltransferase
MEPQRLYRHRFDPRELSAKARVWQTLCDHFFSMFVRPSDTVVDVGAGYCEFVNHIRAARKIAIDPNPDIKAFARPGVEILNEPCTKLDSLGSNFADVVFMSNFLEHLESKDLVFATLAEAKRILKPGGKMMILQPNIRFLPGEYWDFFDHLTPLTDRSLAEALENLDLRIDVLIPRFLPYTTKSRLPQGSLFVRLYLAIPLAWRVLGKQAFIVASKPD